MLTDVWRLATLPERPDSALTDVCRLVTSPCRVVKLPVMELILVESVFTLFCRLATAVLALVAAVAADCALLATLARDVDMPERPVLRVLPHVVKFLPTPATLLERAVMLVCRAVTPVPILVMLVCRAVTPVPIVVTLPVREVRPV